MNLLKNSKYTLFANIVNQISSIIIFLIVPNIVIQDDYAQIIFILVLLSFLVISDFGMSFVYGRKMPSIYYNGDIKQIEAYNQTFFWFRLIMSFIGSIVVSTIYFLRYEDFLNSLALLCLNPLMVIISFSVSQYSAKEDFKFYQNINIKGAFARILIIPFVYFYGICGWIVAQIFASLIVLKTMKERVFLKHECFDIRLIRIHFREGVILLLLFFFWNQLLNSGRLFASFVFDGDLLAQYGLTNNAYSLFLNLVISVFLPVTVATLKIMETDARSAIRQLFDVTIRTSLFLSPLVILSIEISPFLFDIFFSKYTIDRDVLKYQLLSLMALPPVVTIGNIFQGLQNPEKLAIINIVSFFISCIVFIFIKSKIASAAIAQCIGVNLLGILLLFFAVYFYGNLIDNKYVVVVKILAAVFLPYGLYFFIRSFI
ncbi:hypothetical protein U5B43_04740 [Campylobacter sp. 9BO]|uniref:hypothetical protein n=1 Tax=Campylobacter sp. 9BO TaxID=3424759 RepID=UPI003D35933A